MAQQPWCWTKATSNYLTCSQSYRIELSLTRRSIRRILSGSRRLDDFKRNPQQFIELAEHAINRCKQQTLVDGIKYQRLGDDHYYAQELFETEELTGYLKNMLAASKSVYESVVYESAIEATFTDQLEKNTAVNVYAKLPGWFTVPTPLGSYNPDWAVLIDSDEGERLYFVVETKGQSFPGRSPRHRICQDRVWKGTLQSTQVGRIASPLRSGHNSRTTPRRHRWQLIGASTRRLNRTRALAVAGVEDRYCNGTGPASGNDYTSQPKSYSVHQAVTLQTGRIQQE